MHQVSTIVYIDKNDITLLYNKKLSDVSISTYILYVVIGNPQTQAVLKFKSVK